MITTSSKTVQKQATNPDTASQTKYNLSINTVHQTKTKQNPMGEREFVKKS